VDGSIHGSIATSDVLIIGERAIVQADIKAGEVQIYGTVFGNIDCERRVEIRATGRVRGEVRAPQLIIEEGGGFEGLSRPTAEAPEDQPIDAESMTTAVSH
jgi:cytoskeletal protein CcmA (bactofilin family)